MKPKRMWINQPSTLQPHNKLHGANVLAVEVRPGTHTVYFLSGDVVSMEMFSTCLSDGWRPAPEPQCVVCGTKEGLRRDGWYGYRCRAPECVVF